MKELVERIRGEGCNLGNGIIKVDSFINHQIDPVLMNNIGIEFARFFATFKASRILTAETSGIAPALATAIHMQIPLVFARKNRPITMSEPLEERALSHTKGGFVKLMVSPEYLQPGERVLIIDDFLASARTIRALANLIEKRGAVLVGIGAVIEKVYENGRKRLADFDVPIITLAKIEDLSGNTIVFSD